MDGVFAGSVAVAAASASGLVLGVFSPDVGWLAGIVIGLAVWIYFDHRHKAKKDLERVESDLKEHEKADGETFSKIFERLDRIPAMETKVDLMLEEMRRR